MEAINRQIANRTAALDKETKEKETKILAAAQAYLKEMATKRDKDVSNSKEIHKKEQQAGVQKVDQLKKSGAVWTSVGMLVDLQKPNPHSKGTERMRTLFNTLNEVKVA
ncbi:hypothetical protein AGDE_03673 [Angomonas deanei]|uniref:Clathrin light chain n=1 Tax=Angomonas deanei TaxID=59799 RepID=A0A7G2CFQ6_9TRYP|nr:hypothetical protein AGDE_03673 [Angomonas deanei]CAD2217523.1 Clathrin light chain, putative [Angomonas deanei]|eukprot:EPY40255.1 hypothetical protein AGDE_03673 [Angomonas deanei]